MVRARKIKKIGMWSSDTAELFFEDVRVPQKYLLGEEGMGFTYQMLQFQEERIYVALSGEAFAKKLGEGAPKTDHLYTISQVWSVQGKLRR